MMMGKLFAQTSHKLRKWPLLLVFLFFSLVCISHAQVTTGTLLGTIRDNSGAAIRGATVTVTNQHTGLSRVTVSGDDGTYATNLLPVGDYSISAEFAGFQREERTVTLDIGSQVRVDFALRVGTVSQKIEVTAASSVLDTQTAESGAVIGNTRVTQLPLNGRQFIQLTLLTPGVVPEVKGTLSSPLALSGLSVNANGTRFEDNVFLIDGVSVRDEIYERLTVSPSLDAIQEFRVHTSNYSAEFGGQGGAQINISTKSGTNSLHGDIYEFVRNQALDARNFFDLAKPDFTQNQFGASIGGPIKQDKTFFFANYEGNRIFQGITIASALPTALERSGNFAGMGPIIDPTTGLPFPMDQIPDARITDFAKAYLAAIPVGGPEPGRNFQGFGEHNLLANQFTVRIDHSFSSQDQIFGRFIFSDVGNLEPYPVTTNLAAGSPLPPPGFGQFTSQNSRNLAFQYTHLFSPTLINQFRFGYSYLDAGQHSQNNNVDFPTQFGFQGTNPAPLGSGYPSMVIPGFSTLGDATTQLFTGNNVFSFTDDVVRIIGKHSLKFGGGYARRYVRTEFFFNAAGQYKFLGVFTQNPLADFLLGYPAVATSLSGDPLLHGIGSRLGGYVQDDWRVNSRLTVNLGIRYDLNTPFYERDNKLANFSPEIGGFVIAGSPGHINPAADPSRFPGVPFSTAQQLGYPRSLTNTYYNNVAPRIGFAYSATDSFVIRSSYGIFYVPPLQGGNFGIMGFNPPFTGLKLFTNFDPTNPIPAQTSLVTPGSNVVLGQGPSRNFPTGYIQEWNLSLEKQFGPSLVWETAYIGSRGIDLDGTLFPNQPNASPLPLTPRLKWPILGPDLEIGSAAFDSWYQSLVLRVEKRYSNGLVFSGSYVYSKSEDTNGGSLSNFSDQTNGAPQYSGNIAAEKGPSSFDVRHRFVFNSVYQLPFGSGKRFLSDTQGFVGKLISGWSVNSIIVLQSGSPVTPQLPIDQSNTGAMTDRPNRIGNPNNGPKTPNEWFNINAFELQPFGTFGDAGRGIINGPGYDGVDLSVIKMTPLTERFVLELRVETFNLFNHTNFDLPNREFGTATFGQIFSANNSRQIQFGLKLHF
jgi:outer membrane receptor protein involved in Fe transport